MYKINSTISFLYSKTAQEVTSSNFASVELCQK